MPNQREIAERLLRTAAEHAGTNSSAVVCVEDAVRLLGAGELESSARWSIRSLEHSVGVFSPIYKSAQFAVADLHAALRDAAWCAERDADVCDHVGTERVTRTAHGYLGDAPRGTVQTICVDCGAVLESVRR